MDTQEKVTIMALFSPTSPVPIEKKNSKQMFHVVLYSIDPAWMIRTRKTKPQRQETT